MKRFIPCASALLCLCLSLFSVASSATTEFPNKPVRLIIPYPPGGGTDILARLVASKVSETMKWNIVTENRPGAGGSIGLEAAARSTPDGYTLCLAETSNLAINPALYPNLGYDPETDFSPIMFIGSLPLVLVVSADSPYHSVASLVAAAKKNPLTMASSGNGTVGHLAGEMFKIQAGIPILHAPYKGAAPASVDLVGGHISAAFPSVSLASPHAKAGRLRILGIASLKRTENLPEVPTIAEAGVPGFEVLSWYGLLAPAGTPRSLIDRLNQESVRVLRNAGVKEKFLAAGVETVGSSPEVFSGKIKSEIAKWEKLIKESGIQED